MMQRDELRGKQKRAFTGLAGSPLAQIEVLDEIEQPVAPVATPGAAESKRRGRPRVHANNTEKRKFEESKRIIEEHPDHRGRLHDETSGGYGMKKVEQVVAASERGFKKRKMGAKPDKFEFELDELYNQKRKREQKSRPPGRVAQNWELSNQEKEAAIDELAHELFDGDEASGEDRGTLRCDLCGVVVDWWAHALRHVNDEYQKALTARERYSLCLEARHLLDESFLASVKAQCNNGHSLAVEMRLQELSPKKTSTRKPTRCPQSIHAWHAEQARLRKDPEQLHCKTCGKLVHTPNFANNRFCNVTH